MIKEHGRSRIEVFEERKVTTIRINNVWERIEKEWPEKIPATLSVTDSGLAGPFVIIRLPDNTTEDDHHRILIWARRFWKTRILEKEFDEDSGTFDWRGSAQGKDKTGSYGIRFFICNGSRKGCKIIQKTVTKNIFIADCKGALK